MFEFQGTLMRHALASETGTLARYWDGPVNGDAGFKTVLVYCVGPLRGKLCGHCGSLMLKDLPDWDWFQISAHLRCTKCGTVGYLDTRLKPRNGAPLQTARGPLRPGQRVTVPKGSAVPGWTDEQTRYWLDNSTGPKD
jgi:hypothetical protein